MVGEVFWTVIFYFTQIIFVFVIFILMLIIFCVCDIHFISVFHGVCQLKAENKTGQTSVGAWLICAKSGTLGGLINSSIHVGYKKVNRFKSRFIFVDL